MKKPTIGLALGGGGARGAAHIGALQSLHHAGIRFDRIVGTSAGAVVGAMYAATQDPDWIEKRFREFIDSSEFEALGTMRMVKDQDPHSPFGQLAKKVRDQFVIVMSLNRSSILKKEKLKAAFGFLLPVHSFKDLKIPMEVTATDLQTGKLTVYTSGDLLEAVVQSGSIPGYVEPTIKGETLMADGGVGMPNPLPLLKGKVDISVTVDIIKRIRTNVPELNIYNILQRAEEVTFNVLTEKDVTDADIVIRPDVEGIHWSQFDQFDPILKSGKLAGDTMLPKIQEVIEKRSSWFSRLKEWIGFAR